jgi:hypothetical protein
MGSIMKSSGLRFIPSDPKSVEILFNAPFSNTRLSLTSKKWNCEPAIYRPVF